MKKYFAYGSNMLEAGMDYRCPQAQKIGSWTLPNHKLYFAGVADITPSEGDSVVGALWDITPSDEEGLDIYEGYPYLYDKHWHEDIMFYRLVNDESTDDGHIYIPEVFYLNSVLRGYDDFGIDRTNLFRNMGYPALADALVMFKAGDGVMEECAERASIAPAEFLNCVRVVNLGSIYE